MPGMDRGPAANAVSAEAAVCLNLTRALDATRRVEDFYAIALDALEDGLGVRRSSILLFDDDGVMRFKASRGLSDAYRRAVEGHSPWRPGTPDAEPIVVADVEADPALTPLLPAVLAEGIAAMAFVPLVNGQGVVGKFMLYYDTPHEPSSDELQLAGIIASQVAFAVDRTQSEARARQSEERLRFALDAANMGTWDWNPRTQVIRWSENLERVHGLAPGTFDGTFESFQKEIHPDDRARVVASVERALTTGAPHEVEYRIVTGDGAVRWLEAKGRVEHGPDGRPVRMSGVCMDVTPRKQADVARVEAMEMANRASQRLAAIVESSGDAIVSKDLNGVIMSWNRAAERVFGYTAAEAVGRSITLIIPKERLAEEDEVLARVRAGGPVEMETIRQAKDGRRLPISLMVSPIRDADGRIVGASKIARDISDRKRAEAERDQLHLRLATLVTASASLLHAADADAVAAATIATAQQLLVADAYALWATDRQDGSWKMVGFRGVSEGFAGRVIAAVSGARSSAATLFTDPWPVTDVSEQPLLESLLPAYREEGIRSLLVCPMRFGPDRAGTLVFYYRARREFPASDVEAAQTLANLAAAAMTTADLHDELRRERNATDAARSRASFLADATAILSRSLDYEKTLGAVARLAVPEMADWCAVDILDPAGDVRRLAVAHVDPAKVDTARTLNERYPPDPGTPGGIHDVIRTGRPAMMEVIPPELITADARDDEHRRLLSELALSSYLCLPLVSPRGTLGAMTFVYAESGRRYGERDLAFGQELAARATLALENAFAYQRVNEASRIKDEFLATLSHELRTPLNAILGYAQMLSTGVLSGDGHTKAITVLMRNAHALKQIIDDVLDVARITSGKLRLNVRPLELGDVLKNATATVQPAADAKDVALDLALDLDAPQVLGDADRLQQVVWNLLSNAVKFTPRGGYVRLLLRQHEGWVEVVVTDDGLGIDPAFLPHIFERFRQADSRFAREHAGLGLGLAIVRDLVELHGGTVTASSEGAGTGATFTVRLPAIAAHKTAGPLAPANRPAAATAAPYRLSDTLKGSRILAVDNEEDALGLLRVILESAGADVTTAASGQAALALVERRKFDVLVADIGMPGMDGLELIRHIRGLASPRNGLSALALTAYARSEDRLAALASGFQMHLAKPVNPAELVAAIAALVGRTNIAV